MQKLKIKILRKLGEKEMSSCGRNWYFTSAVEEEGLNVKADDEVKKNQIQKLPLKSLFMVMAVNLDPLKVMAKEELAHFNFPDKNQDIILKVR